MSQYFEFFFVLLEVVVDWKEPLNNGLPGWTNTIETGINQKGTRMVKGGDQD